MYIKIFRINEFAIYMKKYKYIIKFIGERGDYFRNNEEIQRAKLAGEIDYETPY